MIDDDLIEQLHNVRVYGASLEGVVVAMGINPVAKKAAAEILRLRADLVELKRLLAIKEDEASRLRWPDTTGQ